jgi:polar amino acid transport system substrate-binding protein
VILAVVTGKADAINNTVFNGIVMSKKNADIGSVYVPTPVLSSPSVVGIN